MFGFKLKRASVLKDHSGLGQTQLLGLLGLLTLEETFRRVERQDASLFKIYLFELLSKPP
jgi:hypothetical protein